MLDARAVHAQEAEEKDRMQEGDSALYIEPPIDGVPGVDSRVTMPALSSVNKKRLHAMAIRKLQHQYEGAGRTLSGGANRRTRVELLGTLHN